MILQNDFYTIINQESSEGSIISRIAIDKNHQIFGGHFPGLPVVPGVCMMQIVRELMEGHTNQKLRIVAGDNMKFLSVINPEVHPEVVATITYTESEQAYKIQATLTETSTTFFKLKATLQSI